VAAPPLGGTEWELVELAGGPVEIEDGSRPHLVLDLEESHVSGSGGCNRLTGSFALAEGELRFGAIATTLVACAEPVMRRERAFLDALGETTGFALDHGELRLLADDRVVARLEARREPPGR
jgi:heat shock protein HslJ